MREGSLGARCGYVPLAQMGDERGLSRLGKP